MSVRTRADECLDTARKAIDEAIENLSQIVVKQVHGHDDWNESFRGTMRLQFAKLLEIREQLK
jgi:hypothetical protein